MKSHSISSTLNDTELELSDNRDNDMDSGVVQSTVGDDNKPWDDGTVCNVWTSVHTNTAAATGSGIGTGKVMIDTRGTIDTVGAVKASPMSQFYESYDIIEREGGDNDGSADVIMIRAMSIDSTDSLVSSSYTTK